MKELCFDAYEDKVDGGFTASAVGYGIHTEAESLEELRANIIDAVNCFFDTPKDAPTIIRLRVVSEEVLVG